MTLKIACYSALLMFANGNVETQYGTFAEMSEAVLSVKDNGGTGIVLPVTDVELAA